MKLDPMLAKEVDTQRELMLAVETGEMKNRLELIHQNRFKKNNNARWYLVAASITILLAIGIWAINRPDKAERLFAANMTIDPGLPVPMSATKNYVFHDAMVDYKSGKYDLAIIKWEPLLAKNPENDTLNYYLGAASFNTKNYQKAIPFFEMVALQDNSTFYGKAEWYLALSFLITKDFDRLNALSVNSKSDYAQKIKSLTHKLE
jgi:tetratricopeptide (TPR) repeat protein